MTTTGLDLSQFTANADTPEVIELKAKVVAVAKKYTDRHGWCGEVRRALREIGIDDEQRVAIKVTTTHPFEFEVKALPSTLVNLTEDQQKAKLAETIGSVTMSAANAKSLTQVAITAESIASMELVTAPAAEAVAADGNWHYISRDGRVMHHIPPRGRATPPDFREYATYTTCGLYVANRLDSSARGTGRQCIKCQAGA